jgi:hypothetical protein
MTSAEYWKGLPYSRYGTRAAACAIGRPSDDATLLSRHDGRPSECHEAVLAASEACDNEGGYWFLSHECTTPDKYYADAAGCLPAGPNNYVCRSYAEAYCVLC